jgi:ketosteroid isomerase-like protein
VRRRLLRLCALGVALGLTAGCTRDDPERQLRDTVARMARAIESRDLAAFLEHVADDFARESGDFGKADVRRVLAGVLLRNEKLAVSAVVSGVQVSGPRAAARLRVLATGGAGWLPERGQTWDVDTAWRREGGLWKLFNAEWREGL